MNLSTVIRHYRIHNELSLRKLGSRIGIPAATLFRLEQGYELNGANLALVLKWLLSEGS